MGQQNNYKLDVNWGAFDHVSHAITCTWQYLWIMGEHEHSALCSPDKMKHYSAKPSAQVHCIAYPRLLSEARESME